ncbi:Battrachocottus baikalensis orf1 and orf2 genes [Elysia marginata]|uniref:Battrachocottus baikalensis orf1 and orf2 genes n=1 Tax=Elysia marginata TaxID=1093978 RepID=A0AAV4J2I1_9GAST|nr:Battrachocottus baikalensis orf1 and orf2 genes [Elysia marginata]
MFSFKSVVVITNTEAPQGCVLSPLLFTGYTDDCRSSNEDLVPLLQFSDDTTLQGLINMNDEAAYRSEIERFVMWCEDTILKLNTSETKELIIDFRKNKVFFKLFS